MPEVTRRDLLAGVATAGAVAVSGCAARSGNVFGDSPDETDSPGDTTEGTDPGDTDDGTTASGDDRTGGIPENVADLSGIDDASIRTLQTECGSLEDDGITVEGDGSTVVVEAVLPAPNPCHEAVLTAGSVDENTLSLVVDVADTTGDDEACVMCRGLVSYRLKVELTDPPVESVTVDHETGGRHTGTPGLSTPVTGGSIETVDTGCRTDGKDPIVVEFGDDVITITGTLSTENPCHEPVLGSVTVEDDRLSVAVDARSNDGDGTACADCLGAVSYEARVEPVDPSGVTTVTVDHIPGGETTVTR